MVIGFGFGSAVGMTIPSIIALSATPWAAESTLPLALVVRLSTMSLTLTLPVVTASISALLLLMYATISLSWSSVVSSLSASAFSRLVRPSISARRSACAAPLTLCAATAPDAVPAASAPTSLAEGVQVSGLAPTSCALNATAPVLPLTLVTGGV